MGQQLYESRISWVAQSSAITADPGFPTGAAGVVPLDRTASASPEPGGGAVGIQPARLSNRVHVRYQMSVVDGTLGGKVHLFGRADDGTWLHLKSLNEGNNIAVDTAKWSASGTTVAVAEAFEISGANYDRYYVRPASLTGNTISIHTWVGFCRE